MAFYETKCFCAKYNTRDNIIVLDWKRLSIGMFMSDLFIISLEMKKVNNKEEWIFHKSCIIDACLKGLEGKMHYVILIVHKS